MNGQMAKDMRRQANAVARDTIGVLGPAVKAALQNEAVTRARFEAFKNQPFLGRIRWLFMGNNEVLTDKQDKGDNPKNGD